MVGSDWWLAYWSTNPTSHPVSYYLIGYAIWTILCILFALVNSLLVAISGLRASRKIHDQVLTHIVKVPMTFFDTTPTGRILNRFSNDTDSIDSKLPDTLQGLIQQIFIILASVGLQIIVTPFFIIPAIPLFIIYFFIQRYFRKSSVELKRLDSISK